MRIALIGSRGIPARYSGFETFYEQLALRLVEKGHDVTVYNRSHFIKDVKKSYRGVRLVSLPSIPSKHLDTLSHTLISSLHALFKKYDIVYYCIVGNSPLVWLPRLLGMKTLLNVDGEDWARDKWKGFAKTYQLWCERVAGTTANVLIADALGIQKRYKERYDRETIFVPYGANITRDESTAQLKTWGLEPNEYILYVGRFVPENSIDTLVQAYLKLDTRKKLVLVGDAPYVSDYKRHLNALIGDNPNIIQTGYCFGEGYAQLSSHAYVYVQPSGINGTRPALLDQMGFGNCVLVRDSAVNMEVISGAGAYFSDDSPVDSLAQRLDSLIHDPALVQEYRDKVRSRIVNYYNWDRVTDFYEDLFGRMVEGAPLISYDQFIGKPSGSR